MRIGQLFGAVLFLFAVSGLGCSAKASAKFSAGTPKVAPEPPPAEPPAVAAPEPPKETRPKPNLGAAKAVLKKMRARLKADRIEIDEKVHFATDKAEILPDSFGLLDDVVAVLNENPDVKCEVAGHTDSKGKAKHNKKLSQERADAVQAYLAGKGIVAARLSAKGYGPDEPIGQNDTEEGREQNRRVEFRVAK